MDDYSVMSSVKRSRKSSVQEYVDPNEMQKYLAKKQPDLVNQIEQEKNLAEIEQMKISNRLSQLRESQEKSVSIHSNAEQARNSQEENQLSNRNNFAYNPNV